MADLLIDRRPFSAVALLLGDDEEEDNGCGGDPRLRLHDVDAERDRYGVVVFDDGMLRTLRGGGG